MAMTFNHHGYLRCVLGLMLATLYSTSSAELADKLENLIGYTIIDSSTIDHWRDKDGKHDDAFEGCDFDRTIIFTNGKKLECAGYSYHYAYRPTAIILAKSLTYNGQSLTMYKMIVEDEVFDMQR